MSLLDFDKGEFMARDIYAHVPPFGEAKVWSDEKETGQTKPKKDKFLGIGIAPEFEERVQYVKQVRLNGWYTKEDLIKICSMKEMQ